MNIWEWVIKRIDSLYEENQFRLAHLLSRLPEHVTEREYEEVDAIVPEALALARAAEEPWLEIYIRHWNLQSRLFGRFEVEGSLAEAVELIDFANRPQTQGCPQGVCARQDLAQCYAQLDGPGYVHKRLAALDETLEQINPHWPCFTCLGAEKTWAMVDDGRPQDAVAYVESIFEQAREAGADTVYTRNAMSNTWSSALVRAGRADEALVVNTAAKEFKPDKIREVRWDLNRCWILASLGRHDEALEHLRAFAEIEATPGEYERWSQGAELLGLAGALNNNWLLGQQMSAMRAKLLTNGAIRYGIDMAFREARLALARGSVRSTQIAIDAIHHAIPRLRGPAEVPELLDELQQALDLQSADRHKVNKPQSLEELEEAFTNDPEQDLDMMESVMDLWQDYIIFWQRWRDIRGALGRIEEGLPRMRAAADSSPGSELKTLLCWTLLSNKQVDAVIDYAARALLESSDEDSKLSGHWVSAHAERARKDNKAAHRHIVEFTQMEPSDPDGWHLRAQLERSLGQIDEAVISAELGVDLEDRTGPWSWQLMELATLAGRWDLVRSQAESLGMQLDEESGPIDENWGLCYLQINNEYGGSERFISQRTGPVTARVASINPPASDQHFRDLYLLRADPLNRVDEEDRDERYVPIYPALERISAGGFEVHEVEGFHPGEDALQVIDELVDEQGGYLHQRSADNYTRTYAPSDERSGNHSPIELPGIYYLIAIPKDADPKATQAILHKAKTEVAGPPHPGS